MKFYGCSLKHKDELLELNQVTVQAEPERLRQLSDFLICCANEIDGNPSWEHEHFIDLNDGDSQEVDFIVYRKD